MTCEQAQAEAVRCGYACNCARPGPAPAPFKYPKLFLLPGSQPSGGLYSGCDAVMGGPGGGARIPCAILVKQTCPDGSIPNADGSCPQPEAAPVQPPGAMKIITVPPCTCDLQQQDCSAAAEASGGGFAAIAAATTCAVLNAAARVEYATCLANCGSSGAALEI